MKISPVVSAENRLTNGNDRFLDTNCAVDNNDSLTDVAFPVVSSVDYTTDAEFSDMFLYLHDGTLSGNVKKRQTNFDHGGQVYHR